MGGSVSFVDGHIDGPVTDREKLIALCEDVILSCKASLCADCEHSNIDYPHCMGVHFADHLLTNGVVVREKGEWKYYRKKGIAVCTSCSFERKVDDNFGRAVACPNCGADMRRVILNNSP